MNKTPLKQIPLKKRIEFYAQLAELYKAGVPLTKLSELPSLWDKNLPYHQIKAFQNSIKKGNSLHGAMLVSGLFTNFDLSVVASAEESGQLTQIFEYLSNRYKVRANFIKTVRDKSLYPIIILVSALFLIPFPKLFKGDISTAQYLLQSFGVLAGIIGVGYLLYSYLSTTLNNRVKEPSLSEAIAKLPFAGKFYNHMGLEEFFNSLNLLTKSGVEIIPALKKTSKNTNNTNIKMMVHRILKDIENGQNLSDSFVREPLIDDKMYVLIQTAEATGEINKAFEQIAKSIRESLEKRIQVIAAIVPRLIFIMVLIYIGFDLVQQQAERLKMLDSI